MSPELSLAPLFDRAQQVDEFEFACTILRVRGLEGPGWDPLVESRDLTNNVISVIDSPILPVFRMRLLLLLYCHVTEMDDLYSTTANLLRVCGGERYVMDPFIGELYSDGKAANQPVSKAKRVRELATDLGMSEIAQLYEFFLANRVRNAFFHSTYTIVDDAFHITSGLGVTIDRVTSPRVPFDWLLPRIESAVNLSLHLAELRDEYRLAYQSNRLIEGRLGQNGDMIPVELLGGEGGLIGFQSPGQS